MVAGGGSDDCSSPKSISGVGTYAFDTSAATTGALASSPSIAALTPKKSLAPRSLATIFCCWTHALPFRVKM